MSERKRKQLCARVQNESICKPVSLKDASRLVATPVVSYHNVELDESDSHSCTAALSVSSYSSTTQLSHRPPPSTAYDEPGSPAATSHPSQQAPPAGPSPQHRPPSASSPERAHPLPLPSVSLYFAPARPAHQPRSAQLVATWRARAAAARLKCKLVSLRRRGSRRSCT